MRFPPQFQLFKSVPRPSQYSNAVTCNSSLEAHGSKLKAFYKILSRHLPDFAGQFQFEQGGKDF
jgi:hypothetical protein